MSSGGRVVDNEGTGSCCISSPSSSCFCSFVVASEKKYSGGREGVFMLLRFIEFVSGMIIIELLAVDTIPCAMISFCFMVSKLACCVLRVNEFTRFMRHSTQHGWTRRKEEQEHCVGHRCVACR